MQFLVLHTRNAISKTILDDIANSIQSGVTDGRLPIEWKLCDKEQLEYDFDYDIIREERDKYQEDAEDWENMYNDAIDLASKHEDTIDKLNDRISELEEQLSNQ